MRTQKFAHFVLLLLAVLGLGAHTRPASAADGDQYLGKWNGTYRGENALGRFVLTLERGSDGTLTGSITVSDDAGGAADYTSTLKSAAFAGNSFSAAYEPPGDGQTEVSLKGVFNPTGADGDWSVNAKAQPAAAALAMGTWKVVKP